MHAIALCHDGLLLPTIITHIIAYFSFCQYVSVFSMLVMPIKAGLKENMDKAVKNIAKMPCANYSKYLLNCNGFPNKKGKISRKNCRVCKAKQLEAEYWTMGCKRMLHANISTASFSPLFLYI